MYLIFIDLKDNALNIILVELVLSPYNIKYISHTLTIIKVHVTRDKITWPGARIRKKGEGMPNYENNNLFGTMYITIDVKFPKGELKDDEKESISNILKMEPVDRVYNGLGGYS